MKNTEESCSGITSNDMLDATKSFDKGFCMSPCFISTKLRT